MRIFFLFYGRNKNSKIKVVDTKLLSNKQQIKKFMAVIEPHIANVEQDFKKLRSSYDNANVNNKRIKKNEATETYFEHLYEISDRIRDAAKIIEENASSIALNQPEIINRCKKIDTLLKNAKNIKSIFTQQKNIELKSVEELVKSLNYFINVIEDTMELEKSNTLVEESRNMKATAEEEEFIKEIMKELNPISFTQNNK